jgi:hypothetical protein
MLLLCVGYSQEMTAIAWDKKSSKLFHQVSVVNTQAEAILIDRGFKIASRGDDIIELIDESQLYDGTLIDTTSKLKINSVQQIIKFRVDGEVGNYLLSAKLIRYPDGEILSVSAPTPTTDLKSAVDVVMSNLINQYRFRNNKSDIIEVKVKKPMSTMGKLSGYVALIALGVAGFEYRNMSESLNQHKGAVRESTSNASWDEYVTHRTAVMISGSVAIVGSVGWVISF